MNRLLRFQKLFSLILGLSLFTFISCNKDEGTGGEGIIKGVVYVKEYSETGNRFIRQIPAMDEDVYILYGSNSTIGDKVTTSFSGSFEFPQLRDGSYKIYAYSDDSINSGKSKIAVSVETKIDGGKPVTLDTIFILKYKSANDASGKITGKIYIKEYDNDYVYLQRIYAASNEDVYLSIANQPLEIDRVRTSYDGTYLFNNLFDNKYQIYLYQDDTSHLAGKIVTLSPNLDIVQGNTVDADTLFLYKGLAVDKGNATISGKIWLINYKSNGYDIKDIALAQDYDVFLVYGDHIAYDKDTKTDNDGVFKFKNLLKGDYRIYVYSEQEDAFGNLTGATQKIIHQKNVNIKVDRQEFFVTDTVKSF